MDHLNLRLVIFSLCREKGMRLYILLLVQLFNLEDLTTVNYNVHLHLAISHMNLLMTNDLYIIKTGHHYLHLYPFSLRVQCIPCQSKSKYMHARWKMLLCPPKLIQMGIGQCCTQNSYQYPNSNLGILC